MLEIIKICFFGCTGAAPFFFLVYLNAWARVKRKDREFKRRMERYEKGDL